MAHRLLTTARKLEKLLWNGIRRGDINNSMLKRNLSILQKSANNPSLATIIREWQLFCEIPPKGFEKFFKPGTGKQAPKNGKPKEEVPKEAQQPPPSRGTSQPPPKPTQRPYDQWSFGMFGGQSRGTGPGGGKPFGDGGDREKWLVLGMIGTVALLGTLAFYEMGYKEIAWKEFVNNYLAKGIVEKLEVVNKKWVRVRLMPGNTVDGSSVLWFNIGSVDSFERNLENAQIEPARRVASMSSSRAHAACGFVAARFLHSLNPASRPLKQLRPPTVTLPQSRLFTRDRLIKNYGVLPLVGLVAFLPVAVGVFCLWQIATRDAMYSRNKPMVERMDLRNPRCYKIINTNPDHYKPNKELADLLDELSEAEEAAKNCQCPE